MGGFGDVLRGLGSVLNPQVLQQVEQERLQQGQQAQQMGLLALQQAQADKKQASDQSFQRQQDAQKIAAQFELHKQDLTQKAADRLAQIQEQAVQGRITKEEADRRAAELRKEMQASLFAQQQTMAQFMAALRQPPQPQLITNEQGVFQLDRSGNAVPVTGPDGKPLTGKSPTKALPPTAAKGILENNQNLRRAEQALALIKGKNVGTMTGDKEATGWKGFLPDAILQRVDPEGTDARAMLSDLGSLVIHDRSGAAVTAAEFPRLQPFIPSAKDDPETVKKKLNRFVQVYKQISEDAKNFYSESGYKVPDSATHAAPQAEKPDPLGLRK